MPWIFQMEYPQFWWLTLVDSSVIIQVRLGEDTVPWISLIDIYIHCEHMHVLAHIFSKISSKTAHEIGG